MGEVWEIILTILGIITVVNKSIQTRGIDKITAFVLFSLGFHKLTLSFFAFVENSIMRLASLNTEN